MSDAGKQMTGQAKQRAARNRTLTLDEGEREAFGARLLRVRAPVALPEILDRTIHGDIMTVAPLLPEALADLAIVDPPYNLTKRFGGERFRERPQGEYLDWLREWFPGVVRLLRPGGSLYLCGDWRCSSAMQSVMEEHLTVMNRITWQREKGRGAAANWKNGMEDIWFGVKPGGSGGKSADGGGGKSGGGGHYFDLEAVKIRRRVLAPYRVEGRPKDWERTAEGNFRLTCPSNFWDDCTVPYWSMAENTDHPTQKPEKLIAKLVLASCPPGGVVFDPFLGSGTSSVVARKLGRRFVGVEREHEYCLWAEKRLAAAELDHAIQGYEGGVFWERNSKNRNI